MGLPIDEYEGFTIRDQTADEAHSNPQMDQTWEFAIGTSGTPKRVMAASMVLGMIKIPPKRATGFATGFGTAVEETGGNWVY